MVYGLKRVKIQDFLIIILSNQNESMSHIIIYFSSVSRCLFTFNAVSSHEELANKYKRQKISNNRILIAFSFSKKSSHNYR